MERGPLAIPGPVWPPGINLRAFDFTDAMFGDWNTAYNEGFASHFRYTPGTVADCREIAASPGFDAENVLLAYHEGHPVGLVRVASRTIADHQSGGPELLAVSPSYRGQGLGRALFRAALLRLEAIGCRQFHLMVDADGPTAPRLYQSEGFTTTRVRRIWEREM
jgi:ribosomal protein S18 acetylase RimI-like enzyme